MIDLILLGAGAYIGRKLYNDKKLKEDLSNYGCDSQDDYYEEEDFYEEDDYYEEDYNSYEEEDYYEEDDDYYEEEACNCCCHCCCR